LDEPIELVYDVSLGDVVITRLEASIGDRIVEAKIEERSAQKYNDAIASGSSAVMLESDGNGENRYRVSLGNLAPLRNCTLEFSYVTTFYMERGVRKLFLSESLFSSGVNLLDAVSLGITLNGVLLKEVIEVKKENVFLQFDMLLVLTTLSVEKHTREDSVVVCLSHVPNSSDPEDNLVDTQEGESAALAAPTEAAPKKKEIVFLIDCSGSMEERIESARDALLFFVQSLDWTYKFNVVRFGSEYVPLFERSEAYTNESLASAKEFIGRLSADMNGTDLLKPLSFVLNDNQQEKSVVVLSDGEVQDREQVLELVRAHTEKNAVYALGMGDDVDHKLLDGLALEGGTGEAEYIDTYNVRRQLLRVLKLMTRPYYCNISVNWGCDVETTEVPRHVVCGDAFQVCGRLEDGTCSSATLSMDLMNARQFIRRETVSVCASAVQEGEMLHVMYASKKVGSLEKKDAVAMSKKYGVLCEHTCFVAEMSCSGDGGAKTCTPMRVYDSTQSAWSRSNQTSQDMEECCECCVEEEDEKPSSPVLVSQETKVTLADIIALQDADGRWDAEKLELLLGIKFEEGRAKWATAAYWATSVAIAYIEKNFASQREDWDLIVQKAYTNRSTVLEARRFLDSLLLV